MTELSVAPLPDACGGATAVRVGRIRISCFRNYFRLHLVLSGAPVVLYGPNGAGKTNLLEAVSLLAPGRGMRGARLSELDRREGGRFRIQAEIESHDGPHEIETWHEAGGERRRVRLDGAMLRSSAALAEQVAAVWLTPSMDRVLVEGAAGRRRFLDRLVLALYADHAARVGSFERAMRERLHLLRSAHADPLWLAAIEQRMAEAAVAVAAARRDLVADLDRELTQSWGGFPSARLELVGEVERRLDARSALEVEQWLRARYEATRLRDAETGMTSLGIHRTDLSVFDRQTGAPAGAVSTGQQKALLLAILLAEVRLRRSRRGEAPLLLLDEVAAHLDAGRRRLLFDALVDLDVQAWLTGTDFDLFRPLAGRARLFEVVDGQLRERDGRTGPSASL